MLQTMRNNMKGALWLIIILMIVPMVFLGFQGTTNTGNEGVTVATVNGEDIGEIELARAIDQRQNELRSVYGDSLPDSIISDDVLKEPVLDSLIKRRLIIQTASDGDMATAAAATAELLQNAAAFQVDGQFSQDRYRQFAYNQGFTPTGYRQYLNQEMLLTQYVSGIAATGFVTDKSLQRITELTNQKRSFYTLSIPLAPREANMEVSDEEAQTYFEQNQADYQKPADVTIEYIELNKALLADNIEPSEEELRDVYQREQEAFTAAVERKAAHILIEAGDGAAEKIETVTNRLAAGEDFAALAAEFSDDFGSKNLGGDLGYIPEGDDFYPAEFRTALSGLATAEVSEPVVTEIGTHFIKLLDVRGAEPPSFEEQRGRILSQLRNSQANQLYQELSLDLEERSFSVSSLSEVEQALELPVQVVGPFTRSGGLGIASNPIVIETAFSDDVLVEGNTSRLLQLGPDQVVVLRVINQNPSRPFAFEEVKDQVIAAVKTEKAKAEIAAQAETLAAEVRDGKTIEEVAKENELDWQVALDVTRRDAAQRREALTHAFSIDKTKVGGDRGYVSTVEGNNGDYIVVHLTKVTPGEMSDSAKAEAEGLRRRLASIAGEADYAAFEAALLSDADIDRN